MIAEHLLPQYLATRILRLPDGSKGNETEISVAQPVFYCTTKIDHKTYINKISNDPSPGAIRADLCNGISDELLYIAHDDFGITEIIISNDSRTPPIGRVPGQWWMTLAVDQSSLLRCFGNVSQSLR